MLQLDLIREAKKLPYELKKNYLLSQKETAIHKLLLSALNRLGEGFSAEITHGRDEHGRDLVVKQRDPLGSQYIGVIVKMGNEKGELTGATNQEIDEIISQANQAMAHPCPLHELESGTVQINQLWIFFVGRLTRQASERVEHELKDMSRRIFALEETVDFFTNNYPEVFFDWELAEFVEENLDRVESLSLTIDKANSFKRKYVNPWISKWEKAGEITEALSSVIYSNRMPFQKLTEVISSGKRTILTGEPGIGKTTALIKIASDMLKENFTRISRNPTDERLEVPVLIKAQELLEKTPDKIYEDFVKSAKIEERILIKTLLVDGLDEVRFDKREACLRTAVEFAEKFKCGLVMSCRKIPMLVTVLSPFDRYELLPFEYGQAISFVEQTIKDQQLVAILREGILNNELKIQLTPLALELLVEVATYEREVPASLVEIFERYTDLTCGKYDKGRGIESVFEHHIKKRFLSELAWSEFYLKGALDISRESLEIFVNNYADKYGWDEDKLKRFVAETERSGLLRIDDKVNFWHRSFLDFFIALRISEKRTEYPTLNQDIVNIYFDDLWTDVAFYYIGIQREINPEVISGIAEYSAESFDVWVFKILIGRLLQAGWHTPSSEKIKAIGVGLKNIENVRQAVDKQLSSERLALPTIFSDFFYMALSEYSFGSRTLLAETNAICEELESSCDLTSLKNCLLLLWAQRPRLPAEYKSKKVGKLLDTLSQLESDGRLIVRDKFVGLFMLEQIEKENKKALRSIRRKIKRTKELYPGEMHKLLPPRKGTITFSIRRRKPSVGERQK
ncbi:MAG: hypothetical protein HY529_06505 [Chloroflexi bacterium]|nr:hypothetical protein [Chloroflexota bacterium]